MAPQAAEMGHRHLGRDGAGHRIAQGHDLLRAFELTTALPAAAVGPVDFSELLRFTARFAADSGFLIGASPAAVVGLVGSPGAGECSVEGGAILVPRAAVHQRQRLRER